MASRKVSTTGSPPRPGQWWQNRKGPVKSLWVRRERPLWKQLNKLTERFPNCAFATDPKFIQIIPIVKARSKKEVREYFKRVRQGKKPGYILEF